MLDPFEYLLKKEKQLLFVCFGEYSLSPFQTAIQAKQILVHFTPPPVAYYYLILQCAMLSCLGCD